MMYKKCEKTVAAVLFIILALSILPVMYLGRYNHPAGDDYYYGAETGHVWEATGSIIDTVAEAVRGVAYQYHNWQGTYSAMLLMYIPPNIFGDNAYRLVTCVMLLLLTGSIFYLMKPIITEWLKGSKALWILVSSVVAFLCIQTVPSQGETFFWYNGSMYYTGFYSVTLFLFGIMLRYLYKPRKYYPVCMLLMAIFLAGGNYVSLLPAILLTVTLTAYLIYKRSDKAWAIGGVALFMIVFLLVSAAAPGNQVRQSGMWKLPAWKAVLKSLLQGVRYSFAWIRVWWVIAALVMAPFLWNTFHKISLSFRYPIIVCGFAYGIFCSMSCPTFYTMNSTGPARAVAIVYYGFVLFTFFCYYYWLGFLYRLLERKGKLRGTNVEELTVEKGKFSAEIIGKLIPVAIVLLVLVQVFSGAIATCTTGKAIRLLASGEARAYEQEYQQRLAILMDESITDVVFEPYQNQPDMLYVGDLTGDAQDETNQKTAQYFKKNTVRVQY